MTRSRSNGAAALAEAMKGLTAIAEIEKALEPSMTLRKFAEPLGGVRAELAGAALKRADGASAALKATSDAGKLLAHSRLGLPEEVWRSIAVMQTTSDRIRALSSYDIPRADIAKALGIRYQHVRNVLVQDDRKREGHDASEAHPEPAGGARPYVRLGPGGRIVIPAQVREALGLKEDDILQIELCEGQLRLTPYSAVVRAIQQSLRQTVGPERRVVDEFLADKRAETARGE